MSTNTYRVNQLFHNFIGDHNVIICFEEKEMLTRNEKVINLSINPIRFADDIFFNFETNCRSINNNLKKYEVNYDIFFSYADFIKATFAKNTLNSKIKNDSLLIIGQTEKDKVVFDGKNYLTL
ncbi:MAG: hypothetical protein HRT87_07645, partial [Legionellales bacterium]|nr:hypothetical protein [Legionellales bacterium]